MNTTANKVRGEEGKKGGGREKEEVEVEKKGKN